MNKEYKDFQQDFPSEEKIEKHDELNQEMPPIDTHISAEVLEQDTENQKRVEQIELKNIRERLSDKPELDRDLIRQVRLAQNYPSKPIVLSNEQRELISVEVGDSEVILQGNYEPNFGISPCSDPNEHFYDQVWSRDGAHAIGNYYAQTNPRAVRESLETTFRHQAVDGQLPLRVERVYTSIRLIPGCGVWLSKALFSLRKKDIDGRREHAIYKGQDMSGGEDSVPATIIAVGELFINSEEGKEFAQNHYDQLKKALNHFKSKLDPADGLANLGTSPDWAETIQRSGKLGTVNTWWVRALRIMEFMSKQLGHEEDFIQFRQEYQQTKEAVLEKLYDRENAYFRTSVGEDRVDTVASVFGALYLVDAEEAARIEETLTQRVRHSSGLVNFDPPYPPEQVHSFVRAVGNAHYHNENVWPWVTCENIQVKIKIALQHPEESVRDKYKQEAIDDLLLMSKLFQDMGGAYEVVQADKPEPATGKRFGITTYQPPKNLMGNLAAYQGAYQQLHKLGWV
jgi:glycogen debranching enzyme